MRVSASASCLTAIVLLTLPGLGRAQDGPADPPVATAGPAAPAGAPLANGPAPAEPAAAEVREWFGSGRRWSEWSRATGDWGSWRSRLEALGVTVSVATTTDGTRPLAGGSRRDPVARTLFDAGVEWDLERADAGVGRFFVGYQRKGGGDGASCVEDGQGYSNIDAPDFRGVAEVWYERPVGARARVKVGVIDANSEFAFVENGAEFINSSMGFSPSIFPMPTYPDPQPGIVLQTTPTPWSYVGAGVYDGGPALEIDRFHAVFAIGEAGLRWNRAGGGRVGVGAWHTRSLDATAAADTAFGSTSGQYIVIDQTMWSDGREGGRRVAAFAQFGLADRHVSPVASHLGSGIVATGVIPGRASDSVGVSVTSVTFGVAPDCPEVAARETNLGAFYKWHLAGWLALKPDVQWIVHPAGDTARASTVVATLRLDIGF